MYIEKEKGEGRSVCASLFSYSFGATFPHEWNDNKQKILKILCLTSAPGQTARLIWIRPRQGSHGVVQLPHLIIPLRRLAASPLYRRCENEERYCVPIFVTRLISTSGRKAPQKKGHRCWYLPAAGASHVGLGHKTMNARRQLKAFTAHTCTSTAHARYNPQVENRKEASDRTGQGIGSKGKGRRGDFT